MTISNRGGIVGRGHDGGRRALPRVVRGADAASAARGEPAAYVFVMGSLAEILRVFDLPVSFPEINSLQTAVRHVAHEYLNEAEDYGYSPDICGYVKADVAVQLRKGAHPMGTMPPPSLAVAHQRLQHLHQVGRDLGAPVPRAGLHARRAGHARARAARRGRAIRTSQADCAYVAAQLRELITLCEQRDADDVRHRPAARGRSATPTR